MTAPQTHTDEAPTVNEKPQALLPTRSKTDRPLFFVMMIMVFLACLSAIATHSSYKAAGNWRDDLSSTATVQIIATGSQNIDQVTSIAAQILETDPTIESALPLSSAQAENLLRPWLGDVVLPETLPIPQLIDIRITRGQELDPDALRQTLAAEGITAEIDDHGRWQRDIARTARAAQSLAAIALILLVAATMATAAFATQAGLTARRTIIDVLTQVGAKDDYIAQLFTLRFAFIGLKAGIAGALIAGGVACLFWLMSGGSNASFMPGFAIDFVDLLYLSIAPFIAALTCALAARFTVLRSLRKEDAPWR